MSDPLQVEDSFFQAGGNLLPDSPSYVTREADHKLLRLTSTGEYCNVLTARQTGKSSLMVRTRERLHGKSVHTVAIDLSIVGSQEITADEWYFGLVSEIRRQLELSIDERRWWEAREQLSPVQRFSDFLKEVVLGRVPGPIVIFIDEIDSTLSLPFTDDFFVSIRAMYNERASNPENKRLTFVLVGVALPTDLIKSRRRTPYNIGRTVDLKDFSAQNAERFLPGLKWVYPGQSEAILRRILYWTGGHPYLTQRVCAAMVDKGDEGWSAKQVDRLVDRLFFQEGRIREETNLLWIDDYIKGSRYREEMLQVYRAIISGQQVKDEERSIEKSQLKLSGLVKATPEGHLQVRNRIYERVFTPKWAESSLPGILRQKVAIVAMVAAFVVTAAVVVAYSQIVGRGGTPTPEPSPSSTATQVAVIVPTPTLLAPTETDTAISISTSTVTPKDSETPTHTPMDTPLAATPTSTPTSTPRDTPARTATPTFIPIPSSTSTSTATASPTFVIIPEAGSYITAVQEAGVFVEPDADSVLLGGVRVGESVRVIGRAVNPWGKWLYIHRDRGDIEGFAWGPYFGWQEEWLSLPVFLTPTPTPTIEPLAIIQVVKVPFCNEDGKMIGLEVGVRGGDGRYTFFWEDQEVSAIKLEEAGSYLVSWAWGSFSQVGTLTVISGDGQRARQEDIWLSEPTCSP